VSETKGVGARALDGLQSGRCVFNRNIGTFMPGGRQRWWELPCFGNWGPASRPFIVPAW